MIQLELDEWVSPGKGHMKIGESLVKSGLLQRDELEVALQEQKETKSRLGDIVLEKGFVNPEKMAPFLALHFNVPYIRLKDIYKDIPPEVIKLIPEHLALRFNIVPISLSNTVLTIATFDPLDVLAIDTIRKKTGLKIRPVIASQKELHEAMEYCYHQHYRLQEYIDEFVALDQKNGKVEDYEKLHVEANDPPVIQYLNSLIIQAVNNNASDIHLQPKQDKAEVAFRIDGVLHYIDPPPKSMLLAVATRVKILSNLDIAERRLPQDGRFKVKVGSSEVDMRTSCFPTIYGESVVMRLLNASSTLLNLDNLGFNKEQLANFRNLIHYSYGLILVTGPTGSGKTTTLYAALNEIQSTEKNMITLEDPVEYRLPFLQQTNINTEIGFSFARGLRSILRQDPDMIMVGEIRDKETAEIAINAALTGHLVFSTLHTNDAAAATVRLINMGVEPFLITSSLLGVLAQRLVRRVCEDCKEKHEARKEILARLSLDAKLNSFYKGTGCKKCLDSGYKGREGLFELLVTDDAVRSMILARSSAEEIKKYARKNGMLTLRESGLEKLKQGLTSPEEVLRVTQETEGT